MFTDAERATLFDFPREVSYAEIGALTGVNQSGIYEFLKRNIFVKSRPGYVLYLESIRTWGNHLRKLKMAGSSTSEPNEFNKARTNLAALQAQEVELRLARARGEYVPLSDVVDAWAKVGQIVRTQGLGQASRIGAAVPHLTAHDREVVARLMREMLESIAEEVMTLATIGSSGGREMVDEDAPKAQPKLTEVKIPSNRGRKKGGKDTKPRAPYGSRKKRA